MARSGTIVRVMLASPSDVADELEIAREVISAWNAAHTLKTGVILEPVHWQTHATPEMGDRPQAILNRQIVDTCDVLVGIFWTRLGTETGAAESGTTEEIEEFRKAGKPVLLFFSNTPVPPGEIDTEQYERLKVYREKCEAEGIVWGYDSTEQFRADLQRILSNVIGTLDLESARFEILAPEKQRDSVIVGARRVGELISRAYGPKGSRISLRSEFGDLASLRYGYDIAKAVKAADRFEQQGVAEFAEVAADMDNRVGDGTKLAIVIATSLVTEGNAGLSQGLLPTDVTKGIRTGIESAISAVEGCTILCENESDVLGVAVAATRDSNLAKLVVDAVRDVGKDGIVSVEESESPSLNIAEGIRFDRGYLSTAFLTDGASVECRLENPYVLLHDEKIAAMADLLRILENVAQKGRPLLIVARDVEGEALATLGVNAARGVLRCVAVKAPGVYGKNQGELLEDIAVFTGGTVIGDREGRKLQNATLMDLGECREVIVGRETTTILEGAGDPAGVEARAARIKKSIDSATSDYDREKLQERLAALVGKAAVIEVGGITNADVRDNKYRVSTALHSVRNAIASGRVVGGGAVLLRAVASLPVTTTLSAGEAWGIESVAHALKEPVRTLAETAGLDPDAVIETLADPDGPARGVNVEIGEVVDLGKARIFDAAGVVITALRIAEGHSRAVLETSEWDVGSGM